MRSAARFVAVAIVPLAMVFGAMVFGGCNKTLTDQCPSGSRTGAAPHCVLAAECLSSHTGFQLDCSGSDGKCVCSENGVVGDTVDYQDAFCAGSAALSIDEDALEAANSACGWGL